MAGEGAGKAGTDSIMSHHLPKEDEVSAAEKCASDACMPSRSPPMPPPPFFVSPRPRLPCAHLEHVGLKLIVQDREDGGEDERHGDSQADTPPDCAGGGRANFMLRHTS
eukprot:350149-Chlamydomonas_euryale.AAC.2